MEKLALEFKGRGEVSGVMFYQLKREGSICIYKRVDPDGFTSYEVIKAVANEAHDRVFGGVTTHIAAKETYPKAERWGKTERGTQSLEKAEKYFAEICAAEVENKIQQMPQNIEA